MNRHRKGVMPEITREIYKGVKRMDRQQFERFCRELYRNGYEDGKDSVQGIDVDKAVEVIRTVKGIDQTAWYRRGLRQSILQGRKQLLADNCRKQR